MSETTNPAGSGSLSIMDAVAALEQPLPDESGEQGEEEAQTIDDDESEIVDESGDDESDDESEYEESEEADEEEQQPVEQTIKLKVDGEEIEVTLDELKSGYSRTKDYTKKTQELANQRREFEAEVQAISSERQQYQQLLGALQAQLERDAEPDWDTLRQTDPIEYSLQMADWQRKQQKAQAVYAEQQRLAQLQMVERQKAMAQRLQQEAQALQTLIPEWGDKEKAQVVENRVKEQGKKLGFSDEELAQVFDHRAVVALHKAAMFDEMMAKRAQVKPTKPMTKTVQPGAKPNVGNSELKRAKQRLAESGDIRSAVNLLNLLGK